jgi:hypothetical protein
MLLLLWLGVLMAPGVTVAVFVFWLGIMVALDARRDGDQGRMPPYGAGGAGDPGRAAGAVSGRAIVPARVSARPDTLSGPRRGLSSDAHSG